MSTINILQVVVGGKLFTGVVSFLYQYYTHIDHEKVHFDFCFKRIILEASLRRKDEGGKSESGEERSGGQHKSPRTRVSGGEGEKRSDQE